MPEGWAGTNHEAPMITRKRGRVISEGANSASPLQECDHRIPPGSGADVQTSPESDSNDWGLDDLLNSEFDWAIDNDDFAAFPDIGMQEPLLRAEETMSQMSDVPVSRNRGSAQRQKQQELSGGVNKNAMAARINRLKKKEYLHGLEQRVGSLTSENRHLKQENGNLNKRVEELENETRYLRAVLANESMLAQLLSRLSGVNGMKLSTSLFQESSENDHDYAMPRKRMKAEDKGAAGGICLHVDRDHVSVEFCTKCAESASSSLKIFFQVLGLPCGMSGSRNIRDFLNPW